MSGITTSMIQAASWLTLVLLEFHLLRRWYESARMARYPPDARMHAIAYVFGMRYDLVLTSWDATIIAQLFIPAADHTAIAS